MTATLISLISVFMGIIAGILTGIIYKKRSNGIIGDILAGVFGSIFFIKSIGRLGLDPMSIVASGKINLYLFCGNMLLSIIGGIIGVFAANKIRKSMGD